MTEVQQIAALREEIRRAGVATDRIRFGIAIFLLLSLTILLGLRVYGPPWLVLGVPVLIVVPYFVAWPAAFAYRRTRERRLRAVLEHLSITERASLLVPLQRDQTWDTRKVVASLIREFGVTSELTPAAAPDARGDETSPAEARA